MNFEEGPCFSLDDVEIRDRRTLYQGFFQMEKYRLRHRLIEGGWSPWLERELFVRPPAVGVLLYDPYRDAVVLVEQFRIGALQAPEGPWLLELVAGIVEPGESHEDVAHREAAEEAGVEIMDLEYICEYLSSPGGTNEQITLYCGGVDSTGVGGVEGLAEEGEDIWVQVFPREEAWKAVQENYINNASAIIALQWLQFHWQRLQEKWQ
jgi:ADP-ribose pyrophosphatase